MAITSHSQLHTARMFGPTPDPWRIPTGQPSAHDSDLT